METYKPKNCRDCAWSYISYVRGAKLMCALSDEDRIVENENEVPNWCPASVDKRLLDDSESDML